MNPAAVSLAELVSRGMHSLHQTSNDGEDLSPRREVTQAQRPAGAGRNPDVEKLLRSTNGLVERLTWLPASASDDMVAMRRYILHSVEYFITEISAHR